ncbi:DUF4190 domain-containing protein [Peribacillus simplex]|jgi:uncharacterized Tic20 family protein|uniref:DUF4190 domain-containing protein n=2 Tax=Peribacillus simplex TaxID=1478 RepID=UPI00326631D6
MSTQKNESFAFINRIYKGRKKVEYMTEIKQSNSKAIVALIMGVLSLLIPFIGIILGILGLIFASKSKQEIKLTGESGNGLVTAGKVCSIIGIILNVVVILIFLVFFYFAVSTDITTY